MQKLNSALLIDLDVSQLFPFYFLYVLEFVNAPHIAQADIFEERANSTTSTNTEANTETNKETPNEGKEEQEDETGTMNLFIIFIWFYIINFIKVKIYLGPHLTWWHTVPDWMTTPVYPGVEESIAVIERFIKEKVIYCPSISTDLKILCIFQGSI